MNTIERQTERIKTITCPDCNGLAVLYMFPHRYAGTWECTEEACGVSDSCEHENRHIERVETTYFPTPDIDASYETDVYVCDDCLVSLSLDEADPVMDKVAA